MADRYNAEGTRVATIDEMPYGLIPCKAEGCKHWFSRDNKYREGYCATHEHLKPSNKESDND